jgi:hypothetical protein
MHSTVEFRKQAQPVRKFESRVRRSDLKAPNILAPLRLPSLTSSTTTYLPAYINSFCVRSRCGLLFDLRYNMRLLNATTRQLEEFVAEEEIPRYAILSHTWGKAADEVKLQELSESRIKEKPGYQKIDYCCKQALQDGLQWVWIDT